MKTKIRLCWCPEDESIGRQRVLDQARADGLPREALRAIMAARVECIAEVGVAPDDTITLGAVRLAGPCPDVHGSGDACSKTELHDSGHLAVVPTADGCRVTRWPVLR